MEGVMRIEGAPYQVGDRVRVIGSAEKKGSGVDVFHFIDRVGLVDHLDYDCGCGQSYPDDPMIGVTFADGDMWEFWNEELAREADDV
jgi:hypothetical protein